MIYKGHVQHFNDWPTITIYERLPSGRWDIVMAGDDLSIRRDMPHERAHAAACDAVRNKHSTFYYCAMRA